MNPRTLAELITLAALWGASFLFMRLGAGEFGAVALAFVRVSIAAITLVPILVATGHVGALRQHWKPIAVIGIINSALPFLAYSYAALSITAGLSSVFNATSPLWGALIAWLWLSERLSAWRILGLVIGFAGVLGLALSNVNQAAAFKPGGSGWAIVACVAATGLYGFGASAAKRWLTGVPPMAVATGSQLAATAFLALPALFALPATMPSAHAWVGAVLLGAVCTGLAYILYFRLLAAMGPKAITVTFLIPVFAVAWGGLLLGESVTMSMVIGCAVILMGTALTTGLIAPRSAAIRSGS